MLAPEMTWIVSKDSNTPAQQQQQQTYLYLFSLICNLIYPSFNYTHIEKKYNDFHLSCTNIKSNCQY